MIKKSVLKHIVDSDLRDLWNLLNHDEKRIVARNFSIYNYRKNQIIYAEHEDPEMLWCLLKGKVKMHKNGIGDRVQILRLYRPVQYFGYRAWFASEPYTSSATAFEPSLLGCVPMTIVDRLVRSNINIAMFFIHELSRHLGGSDAKIVNLTQKHIRARLAESLLIMAESYGYEDDDQTLKIYMSREDLASLSNMTTSNAIRTLSGFVSERLLVVDGRRIKVLDETRLRKISKYG